MSQIDVGTCLSFNLNPTGRSGAPTNRKVYSAFSGLSSLILGNRIYFIMKEVAAKQANISLLVGDDSFIVSYYKDKIISHNLLNSKKELNSG